MCMRAGARQAQDDALGTEGGLGADAGVDQAQACKVLATQAINNGLPCTGKKASNDYSGTNCQ